MKNEIKMMLLEATESREKQISILQDLIVKSEERVSKVNEMVMLQIKMMGQITQEYCMNIDRLVRDRQTLIEQNSELIKSLEECQRNCTSYQQMYEKLLKEFVIASRSTNNNENKINIK